VSFVTNSNALLGVLKVFLNKASDYYNLFLWLVNHQKLLVQYSLTHQTHYLMWLLR